VTEAHAARIWAEDHGRARGEPRSLETDAKGAPAMKQVNRSHRRGAPRSWLGPDRGGPVRRKEPPNFYVDKFQGNEEPRAGKSSTRTASRPPHKNLPFGTR